MLHGLEKKVTGIPNTLRQHVHESVMGEREARGKDAFGTISSWHDLANR